MLFHTQFACNTFKYRLHRIISLALHLSSDSSIIYNIVSLEQYCTYQRYIMHCLEGIFFLFAISLPLYFLFVCVFFFNVHTKMMMMKMLQILNIIYFAFTKVHYTLPYLFICAALRHVSFEILWI